MKPRGPRDRVPHQRRGPRHLRARRPAGSRRSIRRAARACASTRTATRATSIPPYYDSLIAKLIVHGPRPRGGDRAHAPGARLLRRRGHQDHDPAPRAGSSTIRTSSPAGCSTRFMERVRAAKAGGSGRHVGGRRLRLPAVYAIADPGSADAASLLAAVAACSPSGVRTHPAARQGARRPRAPGRRPRPSPSCCRAPPERARSSTTASDLAALLPGTGVHLGERRPAGLGGARGPGAGRAHRRLDARRGAAARRAFEDPACDYVAFGPVFATRHEVGAAAARPRGARARGAPARTQAARRDRRHRRREPRRRAGDAGADAAAMIGGLLRRGPARGRTRARRWIAAAGAGAAGGSTWSGSWAAARAPSDGGWPSGSGCRSSTSTTRSSATSGRTIRAALRGAGRGRLPRAGGRVSRGHASPAGRRRRDGRRLLRVRRRTAARRAARNGRRFPRRAVRDHRARGWQGKTDRPLFQERGAGSAPLSRSGRPSIEWRTVDRRPRRRRDDRRGGGPGAHRRSTISTAPDERRLRPACAI